MKSTIPLRRRNPTTEDTAQDGASSQSANNMNPIIPVRSRIPGTEDTAEDGASSKSHLPINTPTGPRGFCTRAKALATSASQPASSLSIHTPALAAEFKSAFTKYLIKKRYLTQKRSRINRNGPPDEFWKVEVQPPIATRIQAQISQAKLDYYVGLYGLLGVLKFEDIPEAEKEEMADEFRVWVVRGVLWGNTNFQPS